MTTHNTAPNQYVEAEGVRYAFRRFGKPGGTPVIFLHHFIGTMDWWDPKLVDGLARTREVILFPQFHLGVDDAEVHVVFTD